MTTTMQSIVSQLLLNKITTIVPLTQQYATDFDLEDYLCPHYKKQWVMSNAQFLLMYTDDDGYIADVNIISQVDDKVWLLELYDGRTVEIENESYSSACDLDLYKKSSFNLNEGVDSPTGSGKSINNMFIDAILYQNKNVIADDIMYQDVQRFIDAQDDDLFDEHTIHEVIEMFNYFIEHDA